MSEKNKNILTGILIIIGIIIAISWGERAPTSSEPLINKVEEKPKTTTSAPAKKPAVSAAPAEETYAVTGYYSPVVRTMYYDGSGPYTYNCDTFLVTKRDNPLVASMIRLIESGNTINEITTEGLLRLNIEFYNISAAYKQKILASTKDKPITLAMIEPQQDGKDGSACSSFVRIIEK